jgi:hypothetical protein
MALLPPEAPNGGADTKSDSTSAAAAAGAAAAAAAGAAAGPQTAVAALRLYGATLRLAIGTRNGAWTVLPSHVAAANAALLAVQNATAPELAAAAAAAAAAAGGGADPNVIPATPPSIAAAAGPAALPHTEPEWRWDAEGLRIAQALTRLVTALEQRATAQLSGARASATGALTALTGTEAAAAARTIKFEATACTTLAHLLECRYSAAVQPLSGLCDGAGRLTASSTAALHVLCAEYCRCTWIPVDLPTLSILSCSPNYHFTRLTFAPSPSHLFPLLSAGVLQRMSCALRPSGIWSAQCSCRVPRRTATDAVPATPIRRGTAACCWRC